MEQLHDRITQGIIIRSKCQWYQDGEKSSKFFLNLEKIKAKRSTIKILKNIDGSEETDNKLILENIKRFYVELF